MAAIFLQFFLLTFYVHPPPPWSHLWFLGQRCNNFSPWWTPGCAPRRSPSLDFRIRVCPVSALFFCVQFRGLTLSRRTRDSFHFSAVALSGPGGRLRSPGRSSFPESGLAGSIFVQNFCSRPPSQPYLGSGPQRNGFFLSPDPLFYEGSGVVVELQFFFSFLFWPFVHRKPGKRFSLVGEAKSIDPCLLFNPLFLSVAFFSFSGAVISPSPKKHPKNVS